MTSVLEHSPMLALRNLLAEPHVCVSNSTYPDFIDYVKRCLLQMVLLHVKLCATRSLSQSNKMLDAVTNEVEDHTAIIRAILRDFAVLLSEKDNMVNKQQQHFGFGNDNNTVLNSVFFSNVEADEAIVRARIEISLNLVEKYCQL